MFNGVQILTTNKDISLGYLPCKITVKAELHIQLEFFITGNASSVAISVGIPTAFDESRNLFLGKVPLPARHCSVHSKNYSRKKYAHDANKTRHLIGLFYDPPFWKVSDLSDVKLIIYEFFYVMGAIEPKSVSGGL